MSIFFLDQLFKIGHRIEISILHLMHFNASSCFVVQYYVSVLVLHSRWRRESWLFYFSRLLDIMWLLRSLLLLHGAVGWFAVCD